MAAGPAAVASATAEPAAAAEVVDTPRTPVWGCQDLGPRSPRNQLESWGRRQPLQGRRKDIHRGVSQSVRCSAFNSNTNVMTLRNLQQGLRGDSMKPSVYMAHQASTAGSCHFAGFVVVAAVG